MELASRHQRNYAASEHDTNPVVLQRGRFSDLPDDNGSTQPDADRWKMTERIAERADSPFVGCLLLMEALGRADHESLAATCEFPGELQAATNPAPCRLSER